MITNDLKWEENTQMLVKKANMNMELLRKSVSFGAPDEDLKIIYTTFIRPILEQSCVVWNSGLTQKCKDDLERIQKTAVKIILNKRYKDYSNALKILDLDFLEKRREYLCTKFAISAVKSEKMKGLFPKNTKTHIMNT